MSEEDKELLINFVKCNEFYKEENGNLTMTIDFELKDELNKTIKNLLDIAKSNQSKFGEINFIKDAIIDEMAEFILKHCNDLKLFCGNKSETLCQAMYEHYNCLKCIKDYFGERCK